MFNLFYVSFAEHFYLVYSLVCPSTDSLHVSNSENADLWVINLGIEDSFSAIEKWNYTPGPNNIPEIVLNRCRYT